MKSVITEGLVQTDDTKGIEMTRPLFIRPSAPSTQAHESSHKQLSQNARSLVLEVLEITVLFD